MNVESINSNHQVVMNDTTKYLIEGIYSFYLNVKILSYSQMVEIGDQKIFTLNVTAKNIRYTYPPDLTSTYLIGIIDGINAPSTRHFTGIFSTNTSCNHSIILYSNNNYRNIHNDVEVFINQLNNSFAVRVKNQEYFNIESTFNFKMEVLVTSLIYHQVQIQSN